MNNIIALGATALLATSALFAGGKEERHDVLEVTPVKAVVSKAKSAKSFTPPAQPKDCTQDLVDYVFVIDPGHGGTDPGTGTTTWGKDVKEAPYVLDISLRMKRYIECRGGIAILTRKGETIYDFPANNIIPFDRKADRFTWDNSPVVAKTAGMRPRLRLGEEVLKRYPNKTIVWISVHVDEAKSSRHINGIHLLVPRSNADSPMTNRLLAELRNNNRSREYTRNGTPVEAALFVNEDERNVYILRPSNNPIPLRYLIEVGNFADATDSYRIRNPFVREDMARILVDGVKNP